MKSLSVLFFKINFLLNIFNLTEEQRKRTRITASGAGVNEPNYLIRIILTIFSTIVPLVNVTFSTGLVVSFVSWLMQLTV
jgi:hypothetical protein